MAIRMSKIKLTPRKAKEFLETNGGRPNFRRVIDHHLQALARDMKAGRWVDNPSPIIFNTDGIMIDGQHRCLAVLQSGVTVNTFVAHNCDDQYEMSVDGDMVLRKFSDYLKAQGVTNYTNVASVVRIIWKMGGHRKLTGRETPSRNELDRTYRRNKHAIDQAVALARRAEKVINPVPMSYVVFVACRTWQEDQVRAFVEGVSTGADLSKEDPRFILRKLMLENRVAQQKLSTAQAVAYAINAWNLYSQGTPATTRRIKWYQIGPSRSPFPTIQLPA